MSRPLRTVGPPQTSTWAVRIRAPRFPIWASSSLLVANTVATFPGFMRSCRSISSLPFYPPDKHIRLHSPPLMSVAAPPELDLRNVISITYPISQAHSCVRYVNVIHGAKLAGLADGEACTSCPGACGAHANAGSAAMWLKTSVRVAVACDQSSGVGSQIETPAQSPASRPDVSAGSGASSSPRG